MGTGATADVAGRRSGRIYQWLSLVLVFYVGSGSVDVTAYQRETASAVVMMMATLLLIMSLTQNAPPAPD
jgi:hypothetical protein